MDRPPGQAPQPRCARRDRRGPDDRLGRIGAPHGRSAGEVAIAWVLRHPAVTGAIVGGRSAAQVEGTVGAADFRLSEAELAEIGG